MSVYIRRFGFDPGDEVLLEIESVNVLDLDPPTSISGIGSGTCLIVGEFEDGPFATGGNAPGIPNNQAITEVAGSDDLLRTFGGLGYAYAGVSGNNPCARARYADSSLAAEYWNGNGFVQLSGKKFRRLLIARVDTTVGSAQFSRQAFLTGASGFSFALQPSQALVVTDSGTDRTATFTATAATVTSGAGTYPDGFVGGETLTLGYDAAANFVVTFLAGDTTRDLVIARINAAAGFAFAAAVTSTTFSLTGIQRGAAAQVRVVSGSGSVLATLGLTAANTAGTGNVANIATVTPQEVKTIVEAGMSGGSIKVSVDGNGALRLEKTYATTDDWLATKSTTTATALGFVAGVQSSNSGKAYVRSTAQTFPNGFGGTETLTLGNDDAPNFTVAFQAGDTTQAAVISRINQYAGYAMARFISGTVMELASAKNGGQVRVISQVGGTIANLGLTSGTTATANACPNGTIPAGTVVQTSDGTKQFVTAQAISVVGFAVPGVAASGVGPYSTKVRHALDDGTGQSSNAGTLVSLQRAIDLGSFAVTNPALATAALTEAQLDAQYVAALAATVDTNTVAKEANVLWSARQSNAIRKAARTNVIQASAGGCFGRVACVRPPLGTTRATALSRSAEPGVGAYRDQRVIYNYPGVNTFVPAIARRGLAGGAGFAADGNVDVGSDGFCASVMSQLPPEENPGQATSFTTAVNSLERSSSAQGFTIDDYKAFRAGGICAPRMDDGACIFQSGVTSVDPLVYPELRNIARRRMADFIQDTISLRGKSYGKKLSTFARRKAYATEIRLFLDGLLSRKQPDRQRIAGYTVDAKKANTPESLGKGLYRLIVRVRTLSSLDAIVLATTIGEQVEVDEQLPEAA